MTTATAPTALDRRWPEEGVTRVPFRAYSDLQVYEQEMTRIFCGESWAYVGLEVEIPHPGDFQQVTIGDRPVVMARDEQGAVHVFVNHCAHRGVKFCRASSGNVRHFTCPYHQWTYDLQGRLRGVPFHRGLKHQGGMPAEFTREEHGLETLQVTVRNGAVFASFSTHVEPFADYLGPTMLAYFDRVFEMGGCGTEDTEHMVTEVAIRAFYRYYRDIMGF